MRILQIRQEPPGGNAVARFDVKLTDDVRLFGLRLVRTEQGHRIRSPNANGCRTVSLSAALAEQITKAAIAAIGAKASDQYRPAA